MGPHLLTFGTKLPSFSESALSKIPPEPKPAATSLLLGVLTILVGLLGAACVGIQVSNLIDASFHGDAFMPSRDALMFMVVTVLGSVVLAFIRDSQNPVAEDSEEVRLRLWPLALGLLIVPIVVAWIQFELFFETVYMFPLVSFIGAVFLSSRFSGWLPSSRFRRTLTFFLIMTVGVPLGTLTATGLTNHFQRHGTGVVWISGSEFEDEEIYMEADEDERLEAELSSPLTNDLLQAVINAKQVDVVEEDGKKYVRLEDGTLQEIEVEKFDWEKLQREAELEQKEQRAIKKEVLRKRNYARRKGGRIFSSP